MAEQAPSGEVLLTPEHHQDKTETKVEKPDHTKLNAAQDEQAKKLQEARAEIDRQETAEAKDRQPNLMDQLNKEQQPSEGDASDRPAGSVLKKITLKKEMGHIRKKLSSGDRIGSRLIHQPAIKAISEVSGKTITRPSGLLGGGVVAFLGTGSYLYLTKYYGLKYNYFMFFLLLVGGFVLGLVIEALIRLFKSSKAS